jgi:oligosaccharyltransferase complex subunit beta
VSPSISELWRDFAREFSIDFDDRDTFAIDHFSFGPDDKGDHTLLSVPAATTNNVVKTSKPVLYHGIAHAAARDQPLVLPLLRGLETTYSADPNSKGTGIDEEGPYVAGTSTGLVTGFQARNGARILWSGSTDLFSDELWRRDSGNEEFVREVSDWVFGLRGVVRTVEARHERVGGPRRKGEYRVKDELVCRLCSITCSCIC